MNKRPIFFLMIFFILGMGLYLNTNIVHENISTSIYTNITVDQGIHSLEQDSSHGIIIFKEDKVSPEAYYYLMQVISEQMDTNVYIFEYPLNIELLAWNQANKIITMNEDVKEWIYFAHGEGAKVANRQLNDQKMITFGGIPSKNNENCLVISGSLDGIYPTNRSNEDAKKSNCDFIFEKGINHSFISTISILSDDHVGDYTVEKQVNRIIELVKNWENN